MKANWQEQPDQIYTINTLLTIPLYWFLSLKTLPKNMIQTIVIMASRLFRDCLRRIKRNYLFYSKCKEHPSFLYSAGIRTQEHYIKSVYKLVDHPNKQPSRRLRRQVFLSGCPTVPKFSNADKNTKQGMLIHGNSSIKLLFVLFLLGCEVLDEHLNSQNPSVRLS